MSKFKPGDKVRRIHTNHNEAFVGCVYTVESVSRNGSGITLKEIKGGYIAENFELFVPKLKGFAKFAKEKLR